MGVRWGSYGCQVTHKYKLKPHSWFWLGLGRRNESQRLSESSRSIRWASIPSYSHAEVQQKHNDVSLSFSRQLLAVQLGALSWLEVRGRVRVICQLCTWGGVWGMRAGLCQGHMPVMHAPTPPICPMGRHPGAACQNHRQVPTLEAHRIENLSGDALMLQDGA